MTDIFSVFVILIPLNRMAVAALVNSLVKMGVPRNFYAALFGCVKRLLIPWDTTGGKYGKAK
jgi:hypothetical protein